MICPKCGTENRPGARFCLSCGAPLYALQSAQSAPVPMPPGNGAEAPAPATGATSADAASGGLAFDSSTKGDSPAGAQTPPAVEATARGQPLPAGESIQAVEPQPTDEAAQPNQPVAPKVPALQNLDNEDPVSFEQAEAAAAEAEVQIPATPLAAPAATEGAAQTAASETASPDASVAAGFKPAPTSGPLAVGTRLANRFEVLEVVSQGADAVVYRARDDLRCPDCGTQNEPDSHYCENCGRELTTHGTVLLEERAAAADPADLPPNAFLAEGKVYSLQAEPVAAAAPAKAFPNGVRLVYAAKSDSGLVRGSTGDPDEDSIFVFGASAVYESVAGPTVGLFIVADGIGGSEAGEVASKKGIEAASTALLNGVILPVLSGQTVTDDVVRQQIQAAIATANAQVLALAQEKHNDMGTTMTLAVVLDERAFIANVGDSRTYLFTNGHLQQITKDHSMVASLVASGMIQPQDIYTHPQRNLILRSLGNKPELEVDVFPEEGGALTLPAGARLVLCCDGLWEMARDEGIEEILLTEPDPIRACDRLVQRANEAGGEDNISVVIVNVAN